MEALTNTVKYLGTPTTRQMSRGAVNTRLVVLTMTTVLRTCPRCKGEFPATLEYFSQNKHRKNGLQCYCKTCKKAEGRNRYPQKLERMQQLGETFIEGRWIQKHWSDGESGFIQLKKNSIAIVDLFDVERLVTLGRWCYSNGYALNRSKTVDGNRQMHRIIWKLRNGDIPAGMEIDHVNLNRLDNRIKNLRLATHSENLRNVGIWSHNTSGRKGVHWYKARNRWVAEIHVNKKRIFLGYFANIEDAAKAYSEASVKYHGEFARPFG